MDVPAQLLDALAPADMKAIGAWWAALSDADQSQLATLCDARQDDCFFGAVDEDPAVPVPRVFGGRFARKSDTRGWAECYAELFDYLVCHEPAEPLVVRTFHIGCTQHQLPRLALEAGKIPPDFRCPIGSEDCFVRRLLSRSADHVDTLP